MHSMFERVSYTIDMQPTFDLMSSYDQLSTIERYFVDEYVSDLRELSVKTGEPLIKALDMPVTPSMIEHSRGYLARPLVLAAIAERIKAVAAELDLTWRRVADHLAMLAFSNMADFVEMDPETGRPRGRLDITDRRMMAAVKKLKWTSSLNPQAPSTLEIELYDKLGPLKQLAEHMGALAPGNPYWRDTENKSRTNRQMRQIDASVDDEKAAELYARRLKNEDDD